FQVRRPQTGGSSLDHVDCIFADGPSNCTAAYEGAPSDDLLTPTYWISTTTSGRGKKRTTQTLLHLSATSSAGPFFPNNELWAVLLHTGGGATDVVSGGGSGIVIPGTGCHRYKLLEIELYAPGAAAADYRVADGLSPLFVEDGAIVPTCTP
ncbi:MAG: hypothetical protein HKN29_15365, partial [Rhodothermales bacterium]|nr:hypothetical protein [Rhodothermales bacterium]